LFHLLDWKEEGRPTGRVIGVKQVNIYQTFAKGEKNCNHRFSLRFYIDAKDASVFVKIFVDSHKH
jgi:hypothetical protein